MFKSLVVTGKNGLKGTLSKKPELTGQVEVRLDNEQRVLVPSESLVARNDGSYYLPLSLSDLNTAQSSQTQGEEVILPLAEEFIQIEKRMKVTGRVRVDKVVQEQDQTVDEPLLREQVDVERIAVNQLLDQPAQTRQEGDTLIVPVMEEVLVVEKRLMLKEELRITVRRSTVHEPQHITLRREEAEVHRFENEDS